MSESTCVVWSVSRWTPNDRSMLQLMFKLAISCSLPHTSTLEQRRLVWPACLSDRTDHPHCVDRARPRASSENLEMRIQIRRLFRTTMFAAVAALYVKSRDTTGISLATDAALKPLRCDRALFDRCVR